LSYEILGAGYMLIVHLSKCWRGTCSCVGMPRGTWETKGWEPLG